MVNSHFLRGGSGSADLGQIQLECWTRFREVLLESNGPARASKPAARHWFRSSIDRSGFFLAAVTDTRDQARRVRASGEGRIRAELYIDADNAIRYFKTLEKDRADIESALGFALGWQSLPERKACRIAIYHEDFDPNDESTWPEQHEWLANRLNRMHEVFAPRVRNLEPIAE